MAHFNLKDATITIRDGGSNFLIINIGEGNFQFTEKRTITPILDRGTVSTVRQGADQLMEISFQFVWEFLESNTPSIPSVEDVLKRRGYATSWVSASTDVDAPFCVNLELVYIPICNGIDTEVLAFPQFHYDELAHNPKDGTVDCKGICNATAALTSRVAQ